MIEFQKTRTKKTIMIDVKTNKNEKESLNENSAGNK